MSSSEPEVRIQHLLDALKSIADKAKEVYGEYKDKSLEPSAARALEELERYQNIFNRSRIKSDIESVKSKPEEIDSKERRIKQQLASIESEVDQSIRIVNRNRSFNHDALKEQPFGGIRPSRHKQQPEQQKKVYNLLNERIFQDKTQDETMELYRHSPLIREMLPNDRSLKEAFDQLEQADSNLQAWVVDRELSEALRRNEEQEIQKAYENAIDRLSGAYRAYDEKLRDFKGILDKCQKDRDEYLGRKSELQGLVKEMEAYKKHLPETVKRLITELSEKDFLKNSKEVTRLGLSGYEEAKAKIEQNFLILSQYKREYNAQKDGFIDRINKVSEEITARQPEAELFGDLHLELEQYSNRCNVLLRDVVTNGVSFDEAESRIKGVETDLAEFVAKLGRKQEENQRKNDLIDRINEVSDEVIALQSQAELFGDLKQDLEQHRNRCNALLQEVETSRASLDESELRIKSVETDVAKFEKTLEEHQKTYLESIVDQIGKIPSTEVVKKIYEIENKEILKHFFQSMDAKKMDVLEQGGLFEALYKHKQKNASNEAPILALKDHYDKPLLQKYAEEKIKTYYKLRPHNKDNKDSKAVKLEIVELEIVELEIVELEKMFDEKSENKELALEILLSDKYEHINEPLKSQDWQASPDVKPERNDLLMALIHQIEKSEDFAKIVCQTNLLEGRLSPNVPYFWLSLLDEECLNTNSNNDIDVASDEPTQDARKWLLEEPTLEEPTNEFALKLQIINELLLAIEAKANTYETAQEKAKHLRLDYAELIKKPFDDLVAIQTTITNLKKAFESFKNDKKECNPNGKNTEILEQTKQALIKNQIVSCHDDNARNQKNAQIINKNLKNVSASQVLQVVTCCLVVGLIASALASIWTKGFWWKKTSKDKVQGRLKKELKGLKSSEDATSEDTSRPRSF